STPRVKKRGWSWSNKLVFLPTAPAIDSFKLKIVSSLTEVATGTRYHRERTSDAVSPKQLQSMNAAVFGQHERSGNKKSASFLTETGGLKHALYLNGKPSSRSSLRPSSSLVAVVTTVMSIPRGRSILSTSIS